MKIHLRQIPADGLHVEGSEERDILELPDENIRVVAPLTYSLDVGVSGTGLFATGTIATELEFDCVRCLQSFRYPVKLESFAVQTEMEGSETVDLTPFVREDILLDLPPHPRCDWDGEHHCPGLIPDKIYEVRENEMAAPGMAAWGELDKLKLRTGK